ncbi:Imm32 family immunity protein [Deinococcus rhizophilus]
MTGEPQSGDPWEADAAIDLREFDGVLVLQGNAAGLRTLARMLLDLAERQPGVHQHLEDWSGLNLGSLPLILQHGAIGQE